MEQLLKKYKEKQPEIVFEWTDLEDTGAKGLGGHQLLTWWCSRRRDSHVSRDQQRGSYFFVKKLLWYRWDLNVDKLKDVIPITQALVLWHPQQGIVKGHFQSN